MGSYMFHSNILNIYGEKGKAWLDALPQLVAATSSKLDLRDLKEVTNLTCNYVLSGFLGDNPIILKLGLDHEALIREAFALKRFAGYGAVKVLSEDKGILLLERAVPGVSLRGVCDEAIHEFSGSRPAAALPRGRDDEAVKISCGIMQKLHQANIPVAHNFPHIKDWLTALDKDWNIPNHYLQKAKKLRDQLLEASKPDVLLHGDLHHDNILKNGETWVVIDPKGVIGEPAYEVAAFIRNPIPELLNHVDATTIIHNRITYFAEVLTLHSGRIIDWCFVQAVLAWVWALEDGCDTSYFEQLAKIFDTLSFA
jgi:streptomycin 6-kinase